MVDAPEKIRVAQDSDGFWTCREAVSGSQEYVRADLVAELEAENEWLKQTLKTANKQVDESEALVETLKREAQQHAQEARTANATIAEIYREVSGGKGEPGNWNGAEPVRRELTALRARVAELEGLREQKDDLTTANALLEEIKQQCLFAGDDGSIGVTEDPHIPADLFDRLCAHLNGNKDVTLAALKGPSHAE